MTLAHSHDSSEHAESAPQSAPRPAAAPAAGTDAATALAEPYAFAFVQWPAVLAVLELPDDGAWFAVRVAAAVWLAVTLPASYLGGRGAAFGNLMVLLCGLVAGSWWTYPSQWTFAWAPALMIGLYAAQRARLKRASPAA